MRRPVRCPDIDLNYIANSLECVPYEHSDLLPDEPGLYFVIIRSSQLKNGHFDTSLAYIGKSGRSQGIRSRWRDQHHRDPDFTSLLTLGASIDIAWLELR